MSNAVQTPYQVLARKYRPQNFDDLLGHETMVRTLRNAFASGRIAHAYILTGVRGVGKTTTARILARALNYEVPGSVDAPSIDMPEQGLHCQAIAESRHQDVIEMDAASRTGVGDIRELIEAVRYAPVEARYKVYIIDEVHMLSTSAFNALLKTLEEPPPHVKFIFATTEIRKVPVTVLSRCQRFDLKRFDGETLTTYLAGICEKESVEIAREGLRMIARAAEGSVRDALSLLDQAIIQSTANDDEAISAQTVRDMLGLVDRGVSWSLLEAALTGNAPEALSLFRGQFDEGADPVIILKDLLELVHLLTRIKAAGKEAAAQGPAGEADAARAVSLAEKMPMAALTRAWNLLMKGYGETLTAPDPAASGEIALIRLCYAADLPTPDEALRLLTEGKGAPSGVAQKAALKTTPSPQNAAASAGSAATTAPSGAATTPPTDGVRMTATGGRQEAIQAEIKPAESEPSLNEPSLRSLKDVAALAGQKRDAKLCTEIETMMRLVKFEPGRIEFHPTANAPKNLSGRLAQKLAEWTGERWVVSVNVRAAGQATLRSERDEQLFQHPMMVAAMNAFPEIDKDKHILINRLTGAAAQDPALEPGSGDEDAPDIPSPADAQNDPVQEDG